MTINTRYFGEVSLEQEEIVHFPDAIYGFEDYNDYLVITFEADNDSLLCMQSIDEPDLAFVLVNPFDILQGYNPVLEDADLKRINADSKTKLLFYSIAVIREDGSVTVNLKSPIAINPTNRLAKQVILEDTNLSMRHLVVKGNKG